MPEVNVVKRDEIDSRIRRQAGSGSEHFKINEFGDVGLLKQIQDHKIKYFACERDFFLCKKSHE